MAGKPGRFIVELTEPAFLGKNMAEIADRIEVDPNRCHGKPVIKDTRVLVRTVLGSLAAGDSVERVAEAYGVSVQDVRAAIAFANELVAERQQHR
jgi:uncharacterized protein (DUF433 family)